MKKILAILALTLYCATAALAAEGMKTLPAKVGDVNFPHAKHQELLKSCTPCHADSKGGKIDKLAKKDEAHKLCKSCHETKKKGPTKCGECHKKKR